MTVAEWVQAELPDRGLRLSSTTPESRLRVTEVDFRVMVRSEVNPDTLILVEANPGRATVIYTPSPQTAEGVFQVGGAPATRALFRLEVPESVDPGPAACARVECPVDVSVDRLLFASLALRTHPTLSPGFSPVDTVMVQLRPVLAPGRLPRSPLGSPVQSGLGGLAPELFSSQAETLYEIPMTSYLRNLLQPDSARAPNSSSTLAILSNPEPAGLEVVSFFGPGTPLEPQLRLILTVTDGLSLP